MSSRVVFFGRAESGPGRARRRLAVGLGLLLAANAAFAGATAGSASAAWAPPAFDHGPTTPVKPVTSRYAKPPVMPKYKAQPVSWPTGAADVTLGQADTPARAGTLPLWLSKAKATAKAGTGAKPSADAAAKSPAASATAQVTIADHTAATAAGVDGVVLSVRPNQAGDTQVKLSYASFQDAYGGDWASRLRLVTMPACALTTPQVAACRVQTPLASSNDTAAKTVQADVALPATASRAVVLAASADSSGGNGDYSASTLQPSGSWQAGGVGDAFVWTYPVSLPAVPGKLVPNVALAYDSQSQDGLTSATNNQASWVGDGWDYAPGSIERSYASCNDNPAGSTKTGDNCWSSKNVLTLALNGSNSTLVLDDASGEFHPQGDNNEKVEHLTGATNGAQGGEYWRVTTTDGTQYYFGRNRLPGWTGSTTPTTNSVLTEPVFETDSSRSCYNATFSKSYCQQAYRWNLDYVVDAHKDTIAYFYTPESNAYSHDNGSTADVTYTRSAYLNKIQYGQRDGSVYSTSPAAQVLFSVNGRCDTSDAGCATSTLTSTTASHWPDVPFDENCTSGKACKLTSPGFYSDVMLTGIQTQVLVGTTETNVDSWTLKHSFPATNDSTTQSLWLDSITHSGQDTTAGGSTAAITLSPVTFTGTSMSNRVKVTNGQPPLTRHRLTKITTETGETISIGYSTAVTPAALPSDPAQNTTLAYPAYWTPAGATEPILDWFNRYVVTAVAEQDAADKSNSDIVTSYTPVGDAAWHYDTSPLTPAKRRTWNQWRGFGGMTVSRGVAPDPVTKTVYTYFRGMDGDFLTSTTKRSVSLTDSRKEAAIRDADQYAGQTYETRVYNGSDPTPISDTITDPWTSAATATQSALGFTAYRVGTAKTRVYNPLASGGTRATEVDTDHDSYGRVTAVSDLGDTSTATDDMCTTTKYADNTTAWILDAAYETQTVKVACSATASVPGDVLSQQHAFYDGSDTLGAAPTTGDVTKAQEVASYTGSTANYRTTTTVVDEYGRPTSQTDGLNHTTTTAYTPATDAVPTSIAVTDPMKFTTTTTYDPLRGVAETVSTPAGYVTTTRYDALGRLTDVFNPGRNTASKPNYHYTYSLSNTGPSIVTSCVLNPDASGCVLSETLYDSMLRARETQSPTATGTGRVQTDTFYNTDGSVSATTAPYYSGDAVGNLIAPAQDGDIPSETATLFDGAGRKTAEIAYHLGTETWRSTYSYGGDFTTTVPPAGSPASTTVTDARGNIVKVRQYHAGVTPDYLHAAAGTYDDTTFGFDAAGNRVSETDNAKNNWSWTYNLLGEQTGETDPDSGTSTTTFDAVGKVSTVTNADNQQTTSTYDADGRQTGLYDTSSTSTLSATNKLAEWTFDTLKKGLPSSYISYSGGDTWTDAITLYNTSGNVVTRKLTLTGTDAGLLPSTGYTYSYGYNLNGSMSSQTDPAVGDLPGENLAFGYDSVGQRTTLTSTGGITDAYVTATGYTRTGQVAQYTLSAGGSSGAETMTYDDQTGALTGVAVSGFGHSGDIDNLSYTVGGNGVSRGSGLITKITDKRDAAAATDTQCFTYDYATRLQQAWSATDGCAATPAAGSSSTVGAPSAPYWQSWTYDAAGDRQTQTDHGFTGGPTADATTTFNYPAAGANSVQPHTLTNTTATGPGSTAHTSAYVYDKAGNTTSVTGGVHGDQTLTWTISGRVAADTSAAGTTTNVYDADGTQIIQRDPTTTTLFLDDEQIVLNHSTKALSGTRFYSINGTRIAVRQGGSPASYLIADREGTSGLSIVSTTGVVSRRQYLPFGETRGTVPTDWIGNNGYVGGTDDGNTGFETLGARQYDASTGRFLSIDPVFEATDITQLGGYDYAGNNPITDADPSGQLGSASCAPGMVGGPGACTGYENPTAQFPGPPRGGNGGWSSETVTLPHGTTYHSNVDGHGGTAINHVVFTPPSDATTAWDLAVALDKYKGEHPSTISPELAAKCGCQIDQDDAQHTLWGINAAYNANYIKINAKQSTWKYEETHLWLTAMNGLLGPEPMWNSMPVGEFIPGVELLPEVPFEEPLEAPAVKPEAPAAKAETPSNKINYTSADGAGDALRRTGDVGNDKWQMNTGHGYDREHTGPGGVKNSPRDTGLTPDQIEQGIVDDVYAYKGSGGTVPVPGTPGYKPLQRNVTVGGYSIGYRVSQTRDSTYRIATYWVN